MTMEVEMEDEWGEYLRLQECKERRYRRILMRRISGASTLTSNTVDGGGDPAPESGPGESSGAGEGNRVWTEQGAGSSPSPRTPPPFGSPAAGAAGAPTVGSPAYPEPVFGTMSVSGMMRGMEDTIAVRTSFCSPEINGSRPVHFFAVYDGHGGAHVAALCRERMHVLLEEELMRVDPTPSGESTWTRALKSAFQRMDEMASDAGSYLPETGTSQQVCGCHPLEVALGGSTAVVAVLTQEWIIVANCGDSRAVLGRDGNAIALSEDHKPDRSDELARIEAAGGRVVHVNGPRVAGILAMSRAIGDGYLKPYVISEPDVTFTRRVADDNCLILASDGLWDVVTGKIACQITHECLRDTSGAPLVFGSDSEIEGGGAQEAANLSRSTMAAAILTRLAIGRSSCDNISVIVVDLKQS